VLSVLICRFAQVTAYHDQGLTLASLRANPFTGAQLFGYGLLRNMFRIGRRRFEIADLSSSKR